MGTKRMDFSKPSRRMRILLTIALGANAAAGDIRYVDVNGDGVLDANDRTNLGIQYRKRLWINLH
jgi:hypothetical protein